MNVIHLKKKKSHLSRQKRSVLELAKEKGDKETTEHEAHGEQSRVRIRRLNGANEHSRVARSVVINDAFFRFRLPGIFHACIQLIVIQNERVCFEDLHKSQEITEKEIYVKYIGTP